MNDDEIVELCASGIFPKLPFYLEEREESSLKAFFDNPKDNISEQDKSEEEHGTKVICPISVAERKRILIKVLEKVENDGGLEWWQKLPSKSRVKVILFLSESVHGLQLWSDSECGGLVIKICNAIRKIDVEEEVEESENGLASWFRRDYDECLTPTETDFHNILLSVRKKFSKSDWKYFPACVHGFGWIIQQISVRKNIIAYAVSLLIQKKKPLLTNSIDMTLPPALLFSDDHYDDFKVLGLKILAHIVHTSDKADLVRNNWANVIYDAVQRHCTDKGPVVIELMMSILLKVLEIVEKNPSVHNSEFTKHDQLLKQILFQMEFSSDLDQKRTWLPILNTYLSTLGLATLHWSDKICDVLRDYSICTDFNIWSMVLDVTATLIKNTWIKPACESITEIILRVVFNVSSFHAVCVPEEEKNEIVGKASICLQLLQKCDHFIVVESQLKDITETGNSQLLHPDFIKCLKRILST